MTVRISKPAFNLREKLTELDREIGNHGAQLIKSSSLEETFDLLGLSGGKRNVIVNGAMRFNQRGESSYDAANYTLDRWRYHRSTDGEFDIKPSTVAPPGFSNSLHVDCKVASTTISNGAYARLRYFVEGYDCQRFGKGTSNPKSFCLSFYVKTNITGTYSVNIQDSNSRIISRTYTVTDGNWNRYIIVFPNESSNAIANNNATGLEIQFGLTMGANFTGGDSSKWTSWSDAKSHPGQNANLYSDTDNNLYLTGVQLEPGNFATPFEHLSYGEELALCQRYYYKTFADNNKFFPGMGMADIDGNSVILNTQFPVTMRTSPSGLEQSGTASDYKIRRSTTQTCTAIPSFGHATTDQVATVFTKSSHGWGDGSAVRCMGGTTGAYLGWSAEM